MYKFLIAFVVLTYTCETLAETDWLNAPVESEYPSFRPIPRPKQMISSVQSPDNVESQANQNEKENEDDRSFQLLPPLEDARTVMTESLNELLARFNLSPPTTSTSASKS